MTAKARLRSERKKSLYKLIVAQSDILAAYNVCKLFLETVKKLGDDLYDPLLSAMVVCYARPFVDNKGFGPLPGCWRKYTEKRLQQAHDDMIRIRHEIIAHSDVDIRKVLIVPPSVKLGHLDLTSDRIAYAVDSYRIALSRFPDFHDVCVDILRRLHDAIEQEMAFLYGGKGLPSSEFPLTFDESV
jgi:hypothetical protein